MTIKLLITGQESVFFGSQQGQGQFFKKTVLEALPSRGFDMPTLLKEAALLLDSGEATTSVNTDRGVEWYCYSAATPHREESFSTRKDGVTTISTPTNEREAVCKTLEVREPLCGRRGTMNTWLFSYVGNPDLIHHVVYRLWAGDPRGYGPGSIVSKTDTEFLWEQHSSCD